MVVEQGGLALNAPQPTSSDDVWAEVEHKSEPASRGLWQRVRPVVSVMLLIAAAVIAARNGHDLTGAGQRLADIRWGWLVVAVIFEAASMAVFARLQRWLLRAGGVRVGLRPMVEITLAGNALSTTLPGGVAWASAWAYGQLRRRGADRPLSVWVLLVAGAIGSFALFVLVVVGIELAGSSGPLRGLRLGALALLAVPIALALGFMALRRSPRGRQAARWLVDHVYGGRSVESALRAFVSRFEQVHMPPKAWAEVFGLALLNWIDDLACLIASLLALGVSVPWRGVVVAYAFTQIAASLPITPGGLGVVEASLTALLTAYGVPVQDSLAAVILYRIVSFWALVPIGWGVWVYLDLVVRRGRPRKRPHPWALHRHGPQGAGASEPTRPVITLRAPLPCEDCDDSPDGVSLVPERRM